MLFADILLFSQIADIIRDIDPGLIDQLNKGGYGVNIGNEDATEEQLRYMLTFDEFIIYGNHIYVEFIKRRYAGNSIMTNKWLRYADKIKNDNPLEDI
jgi:hypothetical protein